MATGTVQTRLREGIAGMEKSLVKVDPGDSQKGVYPDVFLICGHHRRIGGKLTPRNLTALRTDRFSVAFWRYAGTSKRELISEALKRLFRFSQKHRALQKINPASRGS